MNLTENKYAQYYLVQEMMDTVQTVRKFKPEDVAFVTESVKKTGKLLFSGESPALSLFPPGKHILHPCIYIHTINLPQVVRCHHFVDFT